MEEGQKYKNSEQGVNWMQNEKDEIMQNDPEICQMTHFANLGENVSQS